MSVLTDSLHGWEDWLISRKSKSAWAVPTPSLSPGPLNIPEGITVPADSTAGVFTVMAAEEEMRRALGREAAIQRSRAEFEASATSG